MDQDLNDILVRVEFEYRGRKFSTEKRRNGAGNPLYAPRELEFAVDVAKVELVDALKAVTGDFRDQGF